MQTQAATPRVDKDELIDAFRRILPAAAVLHEAEDLYHYVSDGLTAYRQLPLIVVLPDTLEQVRQILRLCHARRAPPPAPGGALPLANGVVLGMAKFNRILNLDPARRTARVQPGVRNLAISQAAAPYGLYYAPDPFSQIACTIGGNVAENSGGVHCLKYGLTVHNVLKIKAFTIDGELLTIGGQALDAPGYDLLALLTGSEGMLAVIVEITVKLLPRPACVQVVLAAFDEVEKAGAAVAGIIAAGIIPAGLGWAARSPASTGWASKKSRRCACSSKPRS